MRLEAMSNVSGSSLEVVQLWLEVELLMRNEVRFKLWRSYHKTYKVLLKLA